MEDVVVTGRMHWSRLHTCSSYVPTANASRLNSLFANTNQYLIIRGTFIYTIFFTTYKFDIVYILWYLLTNLFSSQKRYLIDLGDPNIETHAFRWEILPNPRDSAPRLRTGKTMEIFLSENPQAPSSLDVQLLTWSGLLLTWSLNIKTIWSTANIQFGMRQDMTRWHSDSSSHFDHVDYVAMYDHCMTQCSWLTPQKGGATVGSTRTFWGMEKDGRFRYLLDYLAGGLAPWMNHKALC